MESWLGGPRADLKEGSGGAIRRKMGCRILKHSRRDNTVFQA
ncbi:hypothetical protein GYH30_045974 [Glycine max]|nr:hypothetical protein GYH30_045974 [Glycine max]